MDVSWVSPRGLTGLVLLCVGAGLAVVPDLRGQDGSAVIITGAVTHAASFAQGFGPGFTLHVHGQQGTWAIEITNAQTGDRDLIYPMNPPYRFSNRQYVGPGYGESARESASNTPREFAFLVRPGDVGRAWDDVEQVLWPYTHTEAEVQRAMGELTRFPTGTLRFEILDVDFAPCEDRGRQSEECVRGLRFRATITWPPPAP